MPGSEVLTIEIFIIHTHTYGCSRRRNISVAQDATYSRLALGPAEFSLKAGDTESH